MKVLEIRLAKSLRSAIEAGHPWIYASAIKNQPIAAAGTTARVLDKDGFICWGIYEPNHPIAVRVWSRDPNDPPSIASLQRRLDLAWALRQKVIPNQVEGYRLLHGEADGCPGWAVDRYQDVLVVRSDGEAAQARLVDLQTALSHWSALGSIRALVHRRSRGSIGPVSRVLLGQAPQPFACREYSWLMEVDPLQGQKTGWFIDQRENRRLIFEVARGLRVANLFCYSGGFSIAAALGGASQVSSVDISKPAITAAMRNFELNGLNAADYEFVAADAFDWLLACQSQARQFDLMILDPPSFAPNQRSLPNAKRAYSKLLTAAAKLLAPGGLLAASSCSSHVDPAMFREIISAAVARAGRRLQIVADRGAGPDHPELPAFLEGRYLKFVLCKID